MTRNDKYVFFVVCSLSFVTSNGNDTEFEMCLSYFCWNIHKVLSKFLLDSTWHLDLSPDLRSFDLAVEAAGGGRITSFSIRLPHNSLLVCWEGFQEFWRHEVRPDRKIEVSCGTKKHVNSDPNSGYLLYIGDYTTQFI